MSKREEIGRLLSVYAMNSSAVFACDVHAKIVYWNEGCENLFDYAKEEVEGIQTLSLVVPAASVESHLSRYVVEVATGHITPKPMSAGRLVEGTTRNGNGVKFRVGLHRAVTEDGEELAVAVLHNTETVISFDHKAVAKWGGFVGTILATLFTAIQVGLKNVTPSDVDDHPSFPPAEERVFDNGRNTKEAE